MSARSSHEVNGWLISPDGNFCYRFHHDPNSWIPHPFVFVDKWIAEGGTPSQMKDRRKLPLDDALELCGQMLLDGWQKLSTQLGEVTDSMINEELAA